MKRSWIKGLIYGLFALFPGLAAAAQPGLGILIVKSSDNAYFDQSIETLVEAVGNGPRFSTVPSAQLDAEIEGREPPQIVIALGQVAAEAVQAADLPALRINAYLTHEQYDRLKPQQQTTVLLDQPLQRYLAFSKFALGVDSVGIILPRDEKPGPQPGALPGRIGLELNRYSIDQSSKLLPVLRRLLRQNDSLLMLPRQSIYNRDSLKGVLLTSYRNRKPVISYSPAHVKSGALASIYSSPGDIGKHLALLVKQWLADPQKPLPNYEYARFYSIASNRRVARALSIELPDTKRIRARLDELEP